MRRHVHSHNPCHRVRWAKSHSYSGQSPKGSFRTQVAHLRCGEPDGCHTLDEVAQEQGKHPAVALDENLAVDQRGFEARGRVKQRAKQAVSWAQRPGEDSAVHRCVERASDVDPHQLCRGWADTHKIGSHLLSSALNLGFFFTGCGCGCLVGKPQLTLDAKRDDAVLSDVALDESALNRVLIAAFVHAWARHWGKLALADVADALSQLPDKLAAIGCARAVGARVVLARPAKVVGEIAAWPCPLAPDFHVSTADLDGVELSRDHAIGSLPPHRRELFRVRND
jgi:hypothetical protein